MDEVAHQRVSASLAFGNLIAITRCITTGTSSTWLGGSHCIPFRAVRCQLVALLAGSSAIALGVMAPSARLRAPLISVTFSIPTPVCRNRLQQFDNEKTDRGRDTGCPVPPAQIRTGAH